jgi:hypothetical protein
MRTWVLRIRTADRPIFDALVDGRKTIETRARSPAARTYNPVPPADTLLFLCGPARLRRTVARVAIYPSPAALAAHEDVRRVMPWLADADLAAVYESFPGYPERIARHGLVAMELAPSEGGP